MNLDKALSGKTFLFLYGLLNLAVVIAVNLTSDLPVLLSNWEPKALNLLNLEVPQDNFYPPGSSILLMPFVWISPHYQLVVFFYFFLTSLIYFCICNKLFFNWKVKAWALILFTLNPYLIWLVNSSQDTLFEIFLLSSFVALCLRNNYFLSLFPLYLLCLTRPSYWVLMLVFPLGFFLFFRKIRKRLILVPFFALMFTISSNHALFGNWSLATEAPLAVHFSHNPYYYLAIPEFDMDVFLSDGGNMEPAKIIADSSRFTGISDPHLRAGLISIVEHPKSLALNTLQKIDSYFFATQKTPQLPGRYVLSEDARSIEIGDSRLTWPLIIGNWFYFLYRSLLLVISISSITLILVSPDIRKRVASTFFILCLPYLAGTVSGVIYYTESRFKVVSEVMLMLGALLVVESFRRRSRL